MKKSKIAMLSLGMIFIIAGVAFAFDIPDAGTALNDTSEFISGQVEDKAEFLEGIPIDTVTIIMIFIWAVLMFLFKEKLFWIALIGGVIMILYARGFIGV